MKALDFSKIIKGILPSQPVKLTFEEGNWNAVDKLVQLLNTSLIVMPEADTLSLRQAESDRKWNNPHRQIMVGGLDTLTRLYHEALADGIESAVPATHAAWTMLAGEEERQAFISSIITVGFANEISGFDVRLEGEIQSDTMEAQITLTDTTPGREAIIVCARVNGWTGQVQVKEKILPDLYSGPGDIHTILRGALQAHMGLQVMP